MIDLHTHTLFSDGALIPAETARRAFVAGYKAIALTDHVDDSNIDFVIPRMVRVCGKLSEKGDIFVIPGVELTHVDPSDIASLAAEARKLGAKIVVVHGETLTEPVLGFGVSWYSNSFFVGFSTPDIFYRRSFNNESPSLELSEIDYLFTAGYLFPLSEALAVQPSFLLRMNPSGSNIADLSGTFIYNSTFLLGAAYRTNSELIAIAGWQATPQLMIAYSYDYPTGDLSNMSSGSHEISLKYNFGYKINTANPRFF